MYAGLVSKMFSSHEQLKHIDMDIAGRYTIRMDTCTRIVLVCFIETHYTTTDSINTALNVFQNHLKHVRGQSED
jgi:hypothetical protein